MRFRYTYENKSRKKCLRPALEEGWKENESKCKGVAQNKYILNIPYISKLSWYWR